LDMIPDNSVDLACSFDSLVHVEPEVIKAYLAQLAKKLKKDGVGFIQHSNVAAYSRKFANQNLIPRTLRVWMQNKGILESHHWRGHRMSAILFEEFCEESGLKCIGQEMVTWATKRTLIDCFSLFTHKDSKWARPNVIVHNPNFMKEASLIKNLSPIYTFSHVPMVRLHEWAQNGQGPRL